MKRATTWTLIAFLFGCGEKSEPPKPSIDCFEIPVDACEENGCATITALPLESNLCFADEQVPVYCHGGTREVNCNNAIFEATDPSGALFRFGAWCGAPPGWQTTSQNQVHCKDLPLRTSFLTAIQIETICNSMPEESCADLTRGPNSQLECKNFLNTLRDTEPDRSLRPLLDCWFQESCTDTSGVDCGVDCFAADTDQCESLGCRVVTGSRVIENESCYELDTPIPLYCSYGPCDNGFTNLVSPEGVRFQSPNQCGEPPDWSGFEQTLPQCE